MLSRLKAMGFSGLVPEREKFFLIHIIISLNQNLSGSVAVGRSDDSFLFHHFENSGGVLFNDWQTPPCLSNFFMARIAREAALMLPRHVIQRGNGRQQTFYCDEDCQSCFEDKMPPNYLSARSAALWFPLDKSPRIRTCLRLLFMILLLSSGYRFRGACTPTGSRLFQRTQIIPADKKPRGWFKKFETIEKRGGGNSMEIITPNREKALSLLKEYNSGESLIKHALGVEGVMRHIARKYKEDEEKWGIIGLLHDLDYERFPEQHCRKTREIMRERGWTEEYITAVISHGWGICSDVEPKTTLEKTLYTIDELVGFVTACALVRPSKSVMDLEVGSVRKKWKQKGFAVGVNRTVIEKGSQMLGVELDTLIADVIMGMREVAAAIGL